MEPEKFISHVHKMKTHFEELCAKSARDYSSKLRMKRECLRKHSEPTSFENSSDETKSNENFVTKNSESAILVVNSQTDDDNLEERIYENHIFDATLPLDLPHAIRELILTECDYVYNLQQGLYKYKQPFKFGNLISTTKRNTSILFGNITEIWSFHENELLPMFKRNIKNLRQLFNEFEKFIEDNSFYIYVSYVINEKRSAELYQKFPAERHMERIYENHIFDATLPLDLPHAIRELILTECDYVYNLQQGLYKYKQPFKFGNLISTTKRNTSILFGNITEIWSFHENELLPMFKRNIKNLRQLFNEFEKFIEGLRSLSGDNLGIDSFVLKPIQRLVKYPLILRNFLKGIVATARNNDEFESCERLTNKLDGFIGFVDKARCVSEIREYYDMDLLFQLHLLHVDDFTVNDFNSDRIYLSRVFMFDKYIIYTELIEGQIIYRGSFSSSKTAFSMRQNCFTLFENNYQKCEFTAAEEIINRWGDLIRTRWVAADNWSERNSQINNLIASEEVYINNLRKGLSNYGNIFDEKQTPDGLRGKKLTAFGNLEQIADFHEFVLLPMLKNNIYDMKGVFDSFSQFIDDGHFYCYIVYNMNARRSFKLCEKYEKYFKRCQKKIGDKFGIKALLIQPIQMLDKYPILLKSVITACFASKDISIYNEAIKSCGKLSTKIYNLLELTVEAEEINYIKDAKLNFHYQGRLRKVDEFLIRQANRTKYIGKAFLFDKSIILTKFDDGQLIYQGFYSLIDVRVSFMEGHKEFLLYYGDRPSELGYFLGQQSVMRSWVDMITAMKKFVGEQQEIYLKEKIFNKFKYFETREFIESL